MSKGISPFITENRRKVILRREMVQLVPMNTVANHITCSVRRLSERIIYAAGLRSTAKIGVSFDQ